MKVRNILYYILVCSVYAIEKTQVTILLYVYFAYFLIAMYCNQFN